VIGRKAGHAFEDAICSQIHGLDYPFVAAPLFGRHLFQGDPARLILSYFLRHFDAAGLRSAVAISTGALATSEDGRQWLQINGANISRCKSDIVITLTFLDGNIATIGVSTKQCNNPKPTNAQLYFTTARGFSKLLRENGIGVSDGAVEALRQFCGDVGFRPLDNPATVADRQVDPRRYFWEELPDQSRLEWETILRDNQGQITRLLLQKAYMDDPFVPDFVVHKAKRAPFWDQTEVAIYAVDELVDLSRAYQSFTTKPYSVRKGAYRDPAGVTHLAPRFGIVQMQRGGQKQHPEQLQFNLEAGYFYRLEKL
jgi:hypothetical protein